MREIAAYQVPLRFWQGHVSAASPEGILLWSPDAGDLVVVPPNGDPFLHGGLPSQRPPIGAAWGDSGAIEVFIEIPPSLYALARDGDVQRRWDLPHGVLIEDAVRVGTGWIVLYLGGDGRSYLAKWTFGTEARLIWARESPASGSALLRSSGEHLLVTSPTPPFTVRVLDSDGTEVMRFAPPLDEAHPGCADGTSLTTSARAIDLGGAYLQTVHNDQGDCGAVIVYDSVGTPVSVRRRLPVPLTFVGAQRADSSIYALRRLDRLELVHYRWVWAD